MADKPKRVHEPETLVVNMHTSPYDVAIDRSGPFGNPFQRGPRDDLMQVLEKYRRYFFRRVEVDPEFRRRVLALRGKRLGCHCAPKPCHGMIIAEWLAANPT